MNFSDKVDRDAAFDYAHTLAEEIFGDKTDDEIVNSIVDNAIEKSNGNMNTVMGIIKRSYTNFSSMDIKPGDKIKFCDQYAWTGGGEIVVFSEGDEALVKDVSDGNVILEESEIVVPVEYIEKCDKVDDMKSNANFSRKFKVGDEVEFVKDYIWKPVGEFRGWKKGDRITITHLRRKDDKIGYDWGTNGLKIWWIDPSYFKLVNENFSATEEVNKMMDVVINDPMDFVDDDNPDYINIYSYAGSEESFRIPESNDDLRELIESNLVGLKSKTNADKSKDGTATLFGVPVLVKSNQYDPLYILVKEKDVKKLADSIKKEYKKLGDSLRNTIKNIERISNKNFSANFSTRLESIRRKIRNFSSKNFYVGSEIDGQFNVEGPYAEKEAMKMANQDMGTEVFEEDDLKGSTIILNGKEVTM